MSAVAHRLAALVVAGAFVFVALAAGAVPAGTAALSGRLIDAETGAPVQAAELSLPDLGQRASSDTEGAFAFAALPAEPFTLVVSHLGYEARVLVVDPAAQGETPLVLRLRPIYYRGEKVVVSASRYGPELHLTQTNLTGEQIAARAAEKDLPLLLESTPGVYATSDAGNGVGYTALKLRGFDQKRIGVMINGIPLNDPEDHQVYWVDMPDLAASLADVQIQRGVTNSLGGMSAIAGSVNLVTEVLGDERGGRLQLAGGSFGTARQSLAWQSGLLGGRFAMGARISHLASDGYRERSGSDQWGVFWSGRYLTPASSTQVNIYSGRERTHQAWYGLSERALIENRRGNPETYANAVDDFRQPHYELHHRWTLRENLEWASSLYWIHGEGFYENFKADADPVAFGLDTALGVPDSVPRDLVRRKWVDKDQRGLLSRVTWTKGPSRLILGGDAYDFQSRHWGDLQFVEGFASDAAVFLPPYHEYTGDKSVWSVYANEQFALGWGLSALVDLHFQHKQYDFFQQATGNFQGALRNRYQVDYDFFNPKGGLFWQAPGTPLGGVLGLYGHFGIAHREPADSELFDTWSGPDDLGAQPLFGTATPIYAGGELQYVYWTDPRVEAEFVRNYEAGFAWRGASLSLALNGYLMEFQNEVVDYGALDADGQGVRGNADQTLHRGLELGATGLLSALPALAELPGTHRLEVAFARSWDKFERFAAYDADGTRRNLSGNPLAGVPDHLATLSLESDWGPLASRFSLRSAGRQYLDVSGRAERRIDGYRVLDIAFALRPAALGLPSLAGSEIELKLYNALDVEYETWGYYDGWGDGNYKVPAAKSHFLLGVRYDF